MPPSSVTDSSSSSSPQSRDRKVLGDYSGALSYGSTAKYLNIAALVINIIIVVIVITVVAVMISKSLPPSYLQTPDYRSPYYRNT